MEKLLGFFVKEYGIVIMFFFVKEYVKVISFFCKRIWKKNM